MHMYYCLGRWLPGEGTQTSLWPPLPSSSHGQGRVGSLWKPQEIAELLESALGASGKTVLPLTEGGHHLHSVLTGQRPTGTLGVRRLPVGTGGGKWAQRFEGFAWGHLGRDREGDWSLGFSSPGL